MKLSVNWLKQFIPQLDNDEVHQIAEKMSTALTEVESITNIADKLEKIYAGEIIELIKHPQIDNSKVATVKVGEHTYTIVCGADNIEVGSIVPVAIPGATVYDPSNKENGTLAITERDFKEIKSEGMLCSERELGIGDDHKGIYLLPPSTPIGEDISKIFYDTVIEIENKALTHRPDCFSHIGIAREIAVQNGLKLKLPEDPMEVIQTLSLPIEVEVKNTESCKRYSVIVLADVTVGPSPLWLESRLRACGMRSVNNIVDITNYIMLETGQPLHAFDYDKIKDHKLILRDANDGETIKTIDGVSRELKKGMLINADADHVAGIAGIMGGLKSEISTSTKNIILQVENFEMFSIRRTSRELGLRTEASTRFEKGLDANMVVDTLKRAVAMITDIAGGEIASEIKDIYPEPVEAKQIEFDIDKCNTKIGQKIEKKQIYNILETLGIQVLIDNDAEIEILNKFNLVIPTFRRDLNIEEDIVEEVVRIYGYNNLPFTLPLRDLTPTQRNIKFEIEKKIVQTMVQTGSTQIFAYAFVGEEIYNKCEMSIKDNLKIKNPLSPELEYFQDTLLPNLITKIELNQNSFDLIDIFQISKTASKAVDTESGLHIQNKFITGALSEKNNLNDEIFYKVKGKIIYLLERLGIENINFENLDGRDLMKKTAVFHPKKTAIIKSDSEVLGILGYMNPKVQHNFEITNETVLFELNFNIITTLINETTNYKVVNYLPSVSRNISFWIDTKTEYKSIEDAIKSLNIKELIKVSLADTYFDKKTFADKKSLTLEIELQSADKTLQDSEINNIIEQINTKLTNTFPIELRVS